MLVSTVTMVGSHHDERLLFFQQHPPHIFKNVDLVLKMNSMVVYANSIYFKPFDFHIWISWGIANSLAAISMDLSL